MIEINKKVNFLVYILNIQLIGKLTPRAYKPRLG